MEHTAAGSATTRAFLDRRTALGLTLVVVSACSFGSGPLFAKSVYPAGVSWLSLLAWRFVVGAALSWAWVLLLPANRAALRLVSPRQVLVLLGLGAFFVGNSAPYYAALETVDASLAALIVYIYPVLVAILSIRFGRGLQGRRPWFALALATLGAALAVGGIPAEAAPPIGGVLLAIASPIVYSCYIILVARFAGERRGQTAAEARAGGAGASREAGPAGASGAAPAAALMLTGTAAVVLVLALATRQPVLPGEVPAAAWPGLLGIGVVSTAIAIQSFYAGTTRVGAAQAALVSTIEPIYTIVLATILFGERLAPIQVLGGALVIVAVLIAQTTPGTATPAVREE